MATSIYRLVKSEPFAAPTTLLDWTTDRSVTLPSGSSNITYFEPSDPGTPLDVDQTFNALALVNNTAGTINYCIEYDENNAIDVTTTGDGVFQLPAGGSVTEHNEQVIIKRVRIYNAAVGEVTIALYKGTE